MPIKIIIKKKQQPGDFLYHPVEHYSWQESGIYTGKNGDTWVLPNNPEFQSWINDHFYDYRLDSEETASLSSKTRKKDLFLYQKFVRSYISPNTPFRGFLIYHKLGSGKTRTAIATAEPFRKAGFNVVCLVPASLTTNFVDEVKTWADEDLRLPANFNELPEQERYAIDNSLTKKVKEHYKFISYNANNTVKQLEKIDFTNTIIIIDEVHNLLNMMTSAQSKHGKKIYKILMNAVNCRIIALSGTPLLNFTYELALLFNILRGYMTYNGVSMIPLFPENEVEFEEYFVDYVTEKAKNMDVFKRRTVGLVSYYCGIQEELYPELVMHDPVRVEMSDFQFVQYWVVRQEERNSEAKRPLRERLGQTNFGEGMISKARLQKSAKSLVSNTFRPNSRQYSNFVFPEGIDRPKSISKATREVLARLKLSQDTEKWTIAQIEELTLLFSEPTKLIPAPSVSEPASAENGELELELELDHEAYDNFINNWIDLETKRECLQYLVETIETRGCLGKFNHIVSREEEMFILSPETYDGSVKKALNELEKCQDKVLKAENLPKLSKKMAQILYNMHNVEGKEGKKFIYSNFRSLEGVEIFSRALQVAGYQKFNPDSSEHREKQCLRYAIISGAESQEYRRAIIKAFNQKENAHGEYLMAILGTSSVAEGISLKHVRQIHIMEPWWNEVRVQQVIGRGRRIGSHLDLPEAERNVHVFRYLSVLSESQKKQLDDRKEHESTDEHVFNKAQKKARINTQFITMLKEIAVDSVLNAAHNQNLKFGIRPLILSKGLTQTFYPPIEKENILGNHNSSDSKLRRLEGDRELRQKMEKIQLEDGEEEKEIDVKFAVFEWGNMRLKGLYNNDGKPKYVAMIREGSNEFKKSYVYKKDDLTKMTREAYKLYDRVSAETSNEFILRGYLVDKVGLVAKNKIVEI